VPDDEGTPLVIDLREGEVPIVRLEGDLDVSSAPALWDVFRRLLGGGASALEIDASGLAFVDSAGANLLARLVREHVAVVVRNPNRPVRRLLDVSGISRRIEIVDGSDSSGPSSSSDSAGPADRA
jgi:anti-anti-sigma factor